MVSSVLSCLCFQIVNLLEVMFLIHQRFCSLGVNIVSNLIRNISKLCTSIFIHCEYTLFVTRYIISNFLSMSSNFHSIVILLSLKICSKLVLSSHLLSFHSMHIRYKSRFSFSFVDSLICFFFFLL